MHERRIKTQKNKFFIRIKSACGGVALIRAIAAIVDLVGDNDDQNAGINILRRAMEAPLRQIAINAGEEASVIVNRVKEGSGNFGYNASNGT